MLPDWTGKTVAIIGAGPSMSHALADSVGHMPRIAVNRAVAMVPDADMLVSIDGNWPDAGETFAGLRIVGVECGKDALYLPLPYEVVTLQDGTVLHLRSNALSAIRIAADCGAKKILLLGMDTEAYEALHDFRGLTEGVTALIAEMQARGIAVERITETQE